LPRIPSWTLFVFVCLSWGSSWVASKLAVDVLPPLALAAVRALLVCAVMLPLCDLRQLWSTLRRCPTRLMAAALLCTLCTHGPLYWGQQFLPAGLTGLINYGLTPLAFFAFAVASGEQRGTAEQVAGVALGLAGLGLLSASDLRLAHAPATALAAVFLGTLAFCAGTVLARPLLNGPIAIAPAAMNALQMGIGGLASGAVSLMTEALPPMTLSSLWRAQLLLPLGFLVLVSGGAASLAYWRLVRDWGSLRAGAFALVCPLVAVGTGSVLLNERLSHRQWAGCALMLLAAGWLHWSSGRAQPAAVG